MTVQKGECYSANTWSEFNIIQCYKCSCHFAIPSRLNEYFLRNRDESFYCPNGHSQAYIGKTREQRLQEELETQRQVARDRQQALERERRSHASTRGNMTKIKKRIKNGVCPCCNRSFVNLQRHMSTKHSEYAKGKK